MLLHRAGGSGFSPPMDATLNAPQQIVNPGSSIDPRVQHTRGTCTSDGKMMFWPGLGWHVVSDPSELSACDPSDQTAQDVINSGLPINVGPFQWDPNKGGQVLTFLGPGQIPNLRAWGNWISSAAAQAWKALSGKSTWMSSDSVAMVTGITPTTNPPTPLQASLDQIVKTAQFQKQHGAPPCVMIPKGSGAGSVYGSNASSSPVTPVSCDCVTDPMCLQLARQGATAAWWAPDSNGIPTEWVTYPNSPYTYGWYDRWDWLEAMKPGLASEPGTASLFTQIFDADDTHITDAIQNQLFHYGDHNQPPMAKFTHPITGETWGVWLVFGIDALDTYLGGWNSHRDGPNQWTLYAALSPMPQEPWYDYIIDAIEWVPAAIDAVLKAIGDAIGDLLSLIQSLACNDPVQAQALAKSDPRAMAAYLAFAATCPKVDCTNPANATNPACVKLPTTSAPTPWYLQWYVIVPAIALIGFVAYTLAKPSAPANP